MTEKTINVLVIEPGKVPYEKQIPDTLEAKQQIVGGYIEALYPYDDMVALVCNEEGKLTGQPLNRALLDENKKLYDIIAGTFFICGLSEDDFASLPPDMMEKYKHKFLFPEKFMRDAVTEEIKILRETGPGIIRQIREAKQQKLQAPGKPSEPEPEL